MGWEGLKYKQIAEPSPITPYIKVIAIDKFTIGKEENHHPLEINKRSPGYKRTLWKENWLATT